MRKVAISLLIGLLPIVGACASVPKESVTLSVTLGRDLAEVHRAHRALAIKYFERMKQDINQFIDEKYRPFMIRKTIQDSRLLEKVESASQPGARPDALMIMEVFVRKMSEQIESYRKKLLQNIVSQEEEVIQAIDDSYLKLQNANSIVTGYLTSVRKVRDAQAELLDRVKMEGLREKFINKTAKLSDNIAKLVEKARKGEATVEEIADSLAKAMQQ